MDVAAAVMAEADQDMGTMGVGQEVEIEVGRGGQHEKTLLLKYLGPDAGAHRQ